MQEGSAEDLRVESSLRFVDRHLPSRRCRILDAGCGEGRLVARLAAAGHAASGLDHSSEAVDRATAAGREVRLGDFTQHEDDPFDLLFFGSSLHHMFPLHIAAERAFRLLAPGGILLADEFDRAAADRATASWFFDMVDLLQAAGIVESSARHSRHSHGASGSHGDDELRALARDPGADPLDRWQARLHHEPPLSTGDEMLSALSSHFQIESTERTEYLYWFPLRHLEGLQEGRAIGERLLELERRLIEANRIRRVGLRIVARRR